MGYIGLLPRGGGGGGTPLYKPYRYVPPHRVGFFEQLFCVRSNLTNDNIITAYRSGLKTDIDFRGLV